MKENILSILYTITHIIYVNIIYNIINLYIIILKIIKLIIIIYSSNLFNKFQ